MPITALPTPPTRDDPANFAQRGDAFLAALPVFATEANALQTDVNAKQALTSAAAVTATAKSVIATASEAAALTSKNASAASESVALAAKTAAEAALDAFDDRYLGAKAAAPELDNDGAAIIAGALYWDTVLNGGCLRVRQAGMWVTVPANVASEITITPVGNIAATNAQAAFAELDTKKAVAANYTNVNNTSDANKQVSIPQAAAIALKADLLYVENALSISGAINDIGVQGLRGFGAGICPALPTGFSALNGTYNKFSDNYGNYQFTDSSIMVWTPAFFYKYNADNTVTILPRSAYATVAAANTAGYALHRAFYNAGIEQPGVFVDKYACSNNGGIASSIRGKNPLSSNAVHNPFSALTGAPPNFYYGAIAAVKTRGAKFFCNSRFIFSALAMLSLAHGQSASANTCAWYDAAGITNYPKGCNNNALGDANDAALTFASDGYSNAAQTGSANVLAKTTHNGQGSGVADLNGGMWEINLGMTSDGANFYLLKTAADISAITGGNTLATDAWGAPGIAALYDSIGATYGALTASSTVKSFGSAAQVLSAATSGTAWSATGAGFPLLAGVGGANKFGSDYMSDYRNNELCALAGGSWSNDGASAGVWALNLGNVRGNSNAYVGCRAALYL